MLSPTERSLRGRLGAFTQHSRHNTRETTQSARLAFLRRFLDDIPVDLPEGERLRRAEAAKRAYFTRLALLSAKARRQRRQNGGGS